MTKQISADVLIIGAGLAGLMAASTLQEKGIEAIVVDKGRRVGGRLATRRIGPGRADHGAQFFTVRRPEFQSRVEQWLAEGLVYRWSLGWSDGSLTPTTPDGYPRYAVQGGMNNLAQRLAQGLDVRVNVRITSVSRAGNGWQIQDEAGQIYTSQALLLTPPVPQSLALLDAGQVHLSASDREALEQIKYAPCLAGLFWIEGEVRLPEPGAVQRPNAAVSWLADNRRKGISPEATIVTVHASPTSSSQLWPAQDEEALGLLRAALLHYLEPDGKIIESQLKRWRYALPTTLHPERCLAATGLPRLIFAGDAFGGPRVEGAALSGLAAAAMVEQRVR